MDTRTSSSASTNKEYLANEQYAGMKNYQQRKNIYAFGDNIPLTRWLSLQYVNHYNLSSFDEILEVGCGNGGFWKEMPIDPTFKSHVVLTDLSKKMLEECQQNLSQISITMDYQIADIDALPFEKSTFNAVLAHNVVYHSIDPSKAIHDMAEVLKPNGIFCMSVLNCGVNQSIWKLANSLDAQIPTQSFTARFTNVEADELLPTVFNHCEKRHYKNTLKFTSSDPIIDMVKSSPAVQPLALSQHFFTLFREKIEEKIAEKGHFESEFNASLYLCRK